MAEFGDVVAMHSVVQAMIHDGVSRSEVLEKWLIACSRSRSVTAIESALQLMEAHKDVLEMSPIHVGNVMHEMMKENLVDESLTFAALQQEQLERPFVALLMLVNSLIDAGRYSAAEDLVFSQVLAMQNYSALLAELLSAYVRNNQSVRALAALKALWAHSDKLGLNVTGSITLLGLAREMKLDECVELLTLLRDSNLFTEPRQPTLLYVAMNAAFAQDRQRLQPFSGIVTVPSLAVFSNEARLAANNGDVDKAVVLVEGMLRMHSIALPIDYFHEILALAINKLADPVEVVKKLLHLLSLAGMKPTIGIYNTLLTYYVNSGRAELVKATVADMLQEKVTPIPETFRIFASMPKHGREIDQKLNHCYEQLKSARAHASK